jgi:hypothetical protein
MGMDIDYIVAKRKINELEGILNGIESGEREGICDDIIQLVDRIKNKYIDKKSDVVYISDISEIIKRKTEINSMNLSNIKFIDDNGDILKIDNNVIEDFKYTGLSNFDFISTGFYKNGFQNYR